MKLASINELIERCGDDSVLFGAIQELKEYRENPMARMFGCWKFVRENNYADQLKHIAEELAEANEESDFDKFLLECFDILQSAVTLMFILQVKYNVNLFELIERGQAKNEVRYYNK